MLVLSRRKGETLLIGEGEGLVEIFIAKITSNRVSLSIKADSSVEIVRGELRDRAEAQELLKKLKGNDDGKR